MGLQLSSLQEVIAYVPISIRMTDDRLKNYPLTTVRLKEL